ncbi:hypothetical protein HDV00_002503 [Rhizophlyctis rosea]|nr:hypothetical protein HDV00_002503 [Rhizophlyctis rosea]
MLKDSLKMAMGSRYADGAAGDAALNRDLFVGLCNQGTDTNQIIYLRRGDMDKMDEHAFPSELSTHILTYLLTKDLVHLTTTSKTIRAILLSPRFAHLWRVVCKRYGWIPPSSEVTAIKDSADTSAESQLHNLDWYTYALACANSPNMRNRRRIQRVVDYIVKVVRGVEDEQRKSLRKEWFASYLNL